MSEDPWSKLLKARNDLSTAQNYLGDAIGGIEVPEVPRNASEAADRQRRIRRQIKSAEREIDRAKRRLGIEDGGRDE